MSKNKKSKSLSGTYLNAGVDGSPNKFQTNTTLESTSKTLEKNFESKSRISTMDSSSTEESVEKPIKDAKDQLSRFAATASYIFTEFGNSILHSDEVQERYSKKKSALVSKLKSRLESAVIPIKLSTIKNRQLVKAMIAIKFNEDKQIDKSYNNLVKPPSELNKSVNQFWNDNKLRSSFNTEQIKQVQQFVGHYISRFQIKKMKSSSTKTIEGMLNTAFEKNTNNKLAKSIHEDCHKEKGSRNSEEPTLKTIKKILKSCLKITLQAL